MLAALILEGILGLGSNDVRPLMGLVSIAHLAPNIAITARRLHDQDRTAWWLLIWLTGIGAIVTFVFTILPGTPTANRFGPAPADVVPPQAYANGRGTGVPAAHGAASQPNLTEELERLAQLRANGSLTDAEFDVMKSRLLANSR